MALPTRKSIIEKITDYLEEVDSDEEISLMEISTKIVDEYLDLLGSAITKPVTTPHVGLAFKHPALSGVQHVAYEHDGRVWIISATSKVGWWCRIDSDFWRYAEVSTAKAGAPGNNAKGWQVGDVVSRSQRMYQFEIVQTSDKGVLLRDVNNRGATPIAESNEEMARYYRKEVKVVEVDW